jgi:hypothetical protein
VRRRNITPYHSDSTAIYVFTNGGTEDQDDANLQTWNNENNKYIKIELAGKTYCNASTTATSPLNKGEVRQYGLGLFTHALQKADIPPSIHQRIEQTSSS